MSSAEWQTIVRRFEERCARAGLDLVHGFNVRQYNAQAAENEKLPDLGRPDALGLLIGNTRELWPAFMRALEHDPALRAEPHPLDTYVTAQLNAHAIETTTSRWKLILGHVMKPQPFPLQRLADAVDFAAVAPCHLSIHPRFGPWFALRAVLVVDVDGPETASPALERPCRGCTAPCVPALERALAASGTPLSAQSIAAHAADWIGIRDACPVGPSFRYDDAQLAYHYVKAQLRIAPGGAQGS